MHATGASRKTLDETDDRSGSPFNRGAVPQAIGLRPWGGVRTSLLSLVTLIALAAVIVVVLVKSLVPPEQAPPMGAGSSPETAQRTPASDGEEITGTITVARDLTGRIQEGSVLFVIARKAAGPPFAVKRIASPRFPFPYRLGPEDVMMAGSAFDGEVRVSARLSRTGTAGPAQPGDLEGEHAAPVRVGARNVDIAISRAH